MQNEQLEITQYIVNALEKGDCEIYLFTVIETIGASPRPAGSMMVFDKLAEKRLGSLSGGCVEEDLLESIANGTLVIDNILQLEYGVSPEENARLGLPCGGRMKIIAEKIDSKTHHEVFKTIASRILGRELVYRCIDLGSGNNSTCFAADEAVSGNNFVQRFGPEIQLLLIGAGAIAASIIHIAEPLGYAIKLCDPRHDFQLQWEKSGNNHEVSGSMPDDFVRNHVDKNSVVITLSHDPRVDDMALMEAIDSSAFYVGALGSVRTTEKRKQRLMQLGLDEVGIANLKAPVGLQIGSKLPMEIAVAIMAEIIKEAKSHAT